MFVVVISAEAKSLAELVRPRKNLATAGAFIAWLLQVVRYLRTGSSAMTGQTERRIL